MEFAPIALFVYNRPTHLRRTVAALRANPLAVNTDLHVFSDGAKKTEEVVLINEVRDFLRTIDGFASVNIYEREKNCGLAASVIDGVSSICNASGKVIVVEDDLIVASGFLEYMNLALNHYVDESKVMQISGHMFPVLVPTCDDAFFLPFASSWGWATWQRAWQKFDPLSAGYSQLKTDVNRRNAFNMSGAYDYYSMLEAQRAGKVDSWAIRWNLSVFMNDGLVLYPKKSLVENKGFDGSGTHTHGDAPNGIVATGFAPQRLPKPQMDTAICDQIFDYFRERRGARARLRSLAARFFA